MVIILEEPQVDQNKLFVEQFGNCANVNISNDNGQSIFEQHESAFDSVEVVEVL